MHLRSFRAVAIAFVAAGAANLAGAADYCFNNRTKNVESSLSSIQMETSIFSYSSQASLTGSSWQASTVFALAEASLP
jgi:hypothetical protein